MQTPLHLWNEWWCFAALTREPCCCFFWVFFGIEKTFWEILYIRTANIFYHWVTVSVFRVTLAVSTVWSGMRKESKFCWIPVCRISQCLFINSFGLFFSSLLASGSDDQHAIIWDPFRHKKLITMHTGHAANIFSVKVKSTSRFCFFSQRLVNMPKCVFLMNVCLQFLPHSEDRILITGAADTKVHVHDLTAKETIHMFSDHTNRVKRIATAPMWPNTFWSAAEDGVIR